jgi:hypothetical protein
MTKKLSIFLIAILTVAPLLAQPVERSGSALFAPRAGQFQVNLIFGRGLFFPIENSTYLLPGVWSGSAFGLKGDNLTPNQSDDPGVVLHIGSINNNSATNMAGIQGKYFITNRWEVNGMFTMDIGVQPQREYVEGIDFESALAAFKYVQGRLTNNWMAALGTNHYFNNCNGRIFPYLGVLGGIHHSRIQVTLPYTGDEIIGGDEIWTELYYAQSRAGEAFGFSGALTAGVEYNFLPGLSVAIEVRPVNYMYTLARLYSEGLNWNANAHTVQFFAFPQLKLGIRF